MTNEKLIGRIIEKKKKEEEKRDAKNAERVVVGKKPFLARKIYSPVTMSQIEESEKKLGFKLPQFLVELYTKIGNGGFGPGFGIMGIEGGHTDDVDRTSVDLYKRYRTPLKGYDPIWPESCLLFCYWGDTIYSVLDCTKDPAPVYFIEFGDMPDDPSTMTESSMRKLFRRHKDSLEDWFTDWCNGKDLWKEMYKN